MWDITAASDRPMLAFQNLTPVVLAGEVRRQGRSLLAIVDLIGALRLLDVLSGHRAVTVLHEPCLGGRQTRLLTGLTRAGRLRLFLTDTTGRVRVVDPDGVGSTVLDLNCDLTGLAVAVHRAWLVGAFGAAVFGLAIPDT